MYISQPEGKEEEVAWPVSERERVLELLWQQLGVPYAIGGKDPKTGKWIVRGKPHIARKDPDEFDCSGLSRWIIAQGRANDGSRTILPHGTRFQIKKCQPIHGDILPLDLGFADMDGNGGIDHVIVRYSDTLVVEARGPQEGKDYGKVIHRPVSAWEAWRGFYGWWRVPGIHPGYLGGV